MPLRAHPDYTRLMSVIQKVPLETLDRTIFRAVPSLYASDADLLTGEGSLREGGRWNTRGVFRVVYTSFDEHTALAESNAKFLAYGFHKPERRTIVPLRASLQRVLGMKKAAVSIGIDLSDLLKTDWRSLQEAGQEPVTQAIGRAANELNIEAMQVRSDRYIGGMNLIILRDCIRIPANLDILDPAP